MAQLQCLSFIHGLRSHNLDILPRVGTNMSCNATIVEYTDADIDLINQLDLDNPKSHRLRLRPFATAADGSYIQMRYRNERLKSAKVQQLIGYVNSLKPEKRIDDKKHQTMYSFNSGGQTYDIPGTYLQKLATALDEQQEYVYRTDGLNVQFLMRKIDIPQLHIDLMQEFFDCEYTGSFHVKANGHLVLYIDHEGFKLNPSNSFQSFECVHGGGCQANIFIALLNGKLMYRFINHSETHAHNHSHEVAKLHANNPVDTPPMQKFAHNWSTQHYKEGKLYVDLLADSDFEAGQPIQRVENKNQCHDASTDFVYQYNYTSAQGIDVWLCIKRTCTGQAMSKGGNVLFDNLDHHDHGISEVPRTVQRNLHAIPDGEFVENVTILPTARSEQLIFNGATCTRKHVRNVHTSWVCRYYRSSACKGFMLTRSLKEGDGPEVVLRGSAKLTLLYA